MKRRRVDEIREPQAEAAVVSYLDRIGNDFVVYRRREARRWVLKPRQINARIAHHAGGIDIIGFQRLVDRHGNRSVRGILMLWAYVHTR